MGWCIEVTYGILLRNCDGYCGIIYLRFNKEGGMSE